MFGQSFQHRWKRFISMFWCFLSRSAKTKILRMKKEIEIGSFDQSDGDFTERGFRMRVKRLT